MKADDLESGTVVPRSTAKTLKSVALGAFLAVVGLCVLGGGLYVVGASFGLWGVPTNESKTGMLLGSLVVVLIGLALTGFAGFLIVANLIYLRRKERFIIGNRSLFWVMDEETVRYRIPFDNVSSVRLKTRKQENNTYRYIAIQVAELRRKDTIVDKGMLKLSRDSHDCDLAIFDEYELSLEEFYRKLRGRCKKGVGEG
jgi:hypothetical protein